MAQFKLILRIFLNGLKIFNQTYENQIYKRETWSFIYIWIREKVIEKLGFNFKYSDGVTYLNDLWRMITENPVADSESCYITRK